MAPNQPTYNMQDDLSPGNSAPASIDNTGPGGASFEHLQRSYTKGPVVPLYPDDPGTVAGKLEGSGQS